MSYDINYINKDYKELEITLKLEDTSFDIGQILPVPDCKQNTIRIEINRMTDKIKSFEHYNDYGVEIDFITIDEVIDYVDKNYNDDDGDDLIEVLEELKELQKPITADEKYRKLIGA